jgi:putative redox protein
MNAQVVWQSGLRFDGTAETGFTLPLGTGGGAEDGFRPMELLALGLAGCTGMDVISILGKKRQEVTAFEVRIHLTRQDQHPKVFTGAVIEYIISGRQVSEAALVRAIELSATLYCPAQAMFAQVMPIALKYSLYEDQGEGRRSLVASGSYTLPEKAAS